MTVLEREPLLEVLVARLREAADGAEQIALVYGEAGIGKTGARRLLHARVRAAVPRAARRVRLARFAQSMLPFLC